MKGLFSNELKKKLDSLHYMWTPQSRHSVCIAGFTYIHFAWYTVPFTFYVSCGKYNVMPNESGKDSRYV